MSKCEWLGTGTVGWFAVLKLDRNRAQGHRFHDRHAGPLWLDFSHSPSIAGYNSLMSYVSELDRAAWHERAIDASMSARLPSAMEILVETGESERLAVIVKRSSDHALEALSHYLTAAATEILRSQSTDAAYWGGVVRNSVEAAVMAVVK